MKTNKRSRAGRPKAELSLSKVRSALTNGSALISDCDHRSAWARRLRDLVCDHVSDLGGDDSLSTAEHTLVRRASMLTLQLEMMEHQFAEQDGMATSGQLNDYQRALNTVRRTLETLGLQRRQKDVTPDPLAYAREYDRREAEDAEEVTA
jgi:hypothetical protein